MNAPKATAPIGLFGSTRSPSDGQLREMRRGTDEGIRSKVADYLRHGSIVIAIMEYTRDQIDDRFTVSGGSSIVTDGTFHWRLDLAEYVDTYGIDIPGSVIEHMKNNKWIVPPLSDARILEIDQILYTATNHTNQTEEQC